MTRNDSSILDSVTYSPQVNETSFGRSPNGNGQFTVLTPTFNSNNNFPNLSVNYKNEISVFPNPFSNFLKIKTEQNFVVRDVVGKIIYFSKTPYLFIRFFIKITTITPNKFPNKSDH